MVKFLPFVAEIGNHDTVLILHEKGTGHGSAAKSAALSRKPANHKKLSLKITFWNT